VCLSCMRNSVLDRRQSVYDHALLPSLRLLEEAVYKTAHPEVFKIEKPTNKMCFSEVKYIMPAVSSHRAGGLHPITLAQRMPKCTEWHCQGRSHRDGRPNGFLALTSISESVLCM